LSYNKSLHLDAVSPQASHLSIKSSPPPNFPHSLFVPPKYKMAPKLQTQVFFLQLFFSCGAFFLYVVTRHGRNFPSAFAGTSVRKARLPFWTAPTCLPPTPSRLPHSPLAFLPGFIRPVSWYSRYTILHSFHPWVVLPDRSPQSLLSLVASFPPIFLKKMIAYFPDYPSEFVNFLQVHSPPKRISIGWVMATNLTVLPC